MLKRIELSEQKKESQRELIFYFFDKERLKKKKIQNMEDPNRNFEKFEKLKTYIMELIPKIKDYQNKIKNLVLEKKKEPLLELFEIISADNSDLEKKIKDCQGIRYFLILDENRELENIIQNKSLEHKRIQKRCIALKVYFLI